MASRTAGGAARLDPLTAMQKIGYGAGAAVDGVTSNALNLFLMFYATAVCGLPGTLAGIALSTGLIVDAVADPAIGSLSDGWRSRFGRRIPFMIVGTPLAAACFVAIFSLPAGLSQTALFAWLAAMSIGLRVSISVFNLPFYALGAELTDDHGERSRIVAWRWGLGMLSGLMTLAIGFGLFFGGPRGTLARDAYSPFASTCALLLLAGGAVSILASLRLRHRAHDAGGGGHALGAFVQGLGEVARNSTFRALFLSALAMFVAQGLVMALALHANTWFWRLTPAEVRNVSLMLLVGLLVGAPVFGALAPRFEKKAMLIAAIVAMILAEAAPASLRVAGLMPLSRDATALVLVGVSVVLGLAFTAAAVALMAMLADAADEHEWLFGSRREGLYFAGWAFASKAATGLGALIGGIVLDLAGFPGGGRPAIVPADTATTIALAAGPGAAVLSVVAILLLRPYRLDHRRHVAILDDLGQRRAEARA